MQLIFSMCRRGKRTNAIGPVSTSVSAGGGSVGFKFASVGSLVVGEAAGGLRSQTSITLVGSSEARGDLGSRGSLGNKQRVSADLGLATSALLDGRLLRSASVLGDFARLQLRSHGEVHCLRGRQRSGVKELIGVRKGSNGSAGTSATYQKEGWMLVDGVL